AARRWGRPLTKSSRDKCRRARSAIRGDLPRWPSSAAMSPPSRRWSPLLDTGSSIGNHLTKWLVGHKGGEPSASHSVRQSRDPLNQVRGHRGGLSPCLEAGGERGHGPGVPAVGG